MERDIEDESESERQGEGEREVVMFTRVTSYGLYIKLIDYLGKVYYKTKIKLLYLVNIFLCYALHFIYLKCVLKLICSWIKTTKKICINPLNLKFNF